MSRLAPAKKPKGARRNTLSPKSGGVQKVKEQLNKGRQERQLTTEKSNTTTKTDSKEKGAARRRTVSPQRPGHAQTSGLPKPAGRKEQGNPASKASRPASAKHDGLAHKSIARALPEKKKKSPPGKKGGKGAVQPPPQKPAVSPTLTLTSQEVPTQDVEKLLAGGGTPTPTPTQQEPLISGIDPPSTPPREFEAFPLNKISTGFTPKTPEQTINEDACDVSLSPIGSPFTTPLQPAPLLNSKGKLVTPEFPNEDSDPMGGRSLEASLSEDSLLSSGPSSTSSPIDLRALYDNRFSHLYKKDEEINDPAFQARKREERHKRAQEIAAAPLRDYCMQIKQKLESDNNGIVPGNAKIEIPEKISIGSKKSQPGMGAFATPTRNLATNISESTPRTKRKEQESSPVETPGKIQRTDQINRNLFSTPTVTVQTPTPSRKRKEPESSPVDSVATPNKVSKSGTNDDWVLVGPKNKKVPVVPIIQGPLDLNPKENNSNNKMNMKNNSGIKTKATETLETSQKQPTAGPSKNSKSPDQPAQKPANQANFDEMQDQTTKTKKRNLTQTLSFESIFITFSLAAKTSFPARLVQQTVYEFRDFLGFQNCHEYYNPQFRMGPTIKIAKHMMEKAKSFTMKGVDLIAQLSTKSPDFHAKNSYKPTPFKTSKGLVKGIDFRFNDKQIKKKLAAEEHGITHVERMYMDGRPTGTVKLSFNTPIAPLRVGNDENGFINVEPSYFQSLKCSKCQKMGHGTRRCKAKVPRCARCAGGHWTTECTRWYYTECANCHSLEHGAAYRGCPVVLEFEKQTRQRNILIKTNYERLLREEKDRELAQTIQLNDQSTLINNHTEPRKETVKTAPMQKQVVTKEEMQNCVAAAVTAAANIILEKMALNDEENLAEIKQEIFNAIKCSGETAHMDPPADVISQEDTVDLTRDPEPMEAQETTQSSQVESTQIVDLTNTLNSETTESAEAGSATFVANKTNENSENSFITKRPPKPRRKLGITRTPDAKMRQNMSATKARLNKFNNGQKKGKS